MNENLLYILISLFSAITVRILWIALWRICFLKIQKQHRLEQANKIRFLQVQIPKNAVARSSDIDAKDHIQSMKQNIELMNQVYKNFYAIFDEGWKNKEFGNNAISMEILVEKEVIKFILWVPNDHLMTVEKMIASFYTGAIVENIRQPKILEAGKYFAGGEFTLTKDSVHPLKTYESFEADPMDSILSAFSNISRDEKVWIQILVEPLHENWLKKMRKTADDIKEGKKKLWFWWIIQKLRDSGKKETSEKEQKEKKHSFSQQQLSDFDKKMDDELFRVKIRTIATSPDKQRPRKIIDDISRLFNQYNYIGLNTLKFSKAQDLQTFARHYSLRILYPDTSLLTKI